MTLTRGHIAAYLNSQFSNLGAAIGQNSDPLVGFKEDVDAALRKLGVARANLATATLEDSQEEAAETLAEYYAARRIWRQLGDRTIRSGLWQADLSSRRKPGLPVRWASRL